MLILAADLQAVTTAAAVAFPFFLALLHYIFHPALAARNASRTCEELPSNLPKEIGCNVNGIGNKQQKPTHVLSIVVPAYNEEERLPVMLGSTVDFLQRNRNRISEIYSKLGNDGGSAADLDDGRPFSFEIVVVDDGSTDGTVSVARRFAEQIRSFKTGDVLRIVKMRQNSGKGAAVRAGMLLTDADLVLMADADGATEIRDCLNLMKRIIHLIQERTEEGDSWRSVQVAVIGSRAHLQESASVERSKLRTFLMYGFHLCVSTLCSKRVKDTQCGFKMFSRGAAMQLFSNLHLQRWAFDIELVMLCETLHFPVEEIAVHWKEIDGSKLDTGSKLTLLLVSLGMLRDMVCVRLCYSLGIWKVR